MKLHAMAKMNKERLRHVTRGVACMVGAIFLTAPTWGQAEGFKMGLSLEPNLAWMTSRDFEHATDGVRAHFGYQFMADILFTDLYAVGTGVHVFRTGSTVQFYALNADSLGIQHVTHNLNNQYVELPLTFKMRTKEIGYTTYFGKFGAGVGMNTRREADETRYTAYERSDVEGAWITVNDPVVPAPDVVTDNGTALFRASMIVGLGFERRIAGSTALMVGLTYNNSLFSTHKDQFILRTDANNNPQGLAEGLTLTEKMQGHDSFMALSVGIVF